MAEEKGSSKTDTLVKVVLVFFISLLSFSVGTFVGKQVSDSDHRRMALEGEYKTDRSVASTEGKEGGESADKISDKEVESLTEEFVAKEKPTAEGETAKEGEEEKEETVAAAPVTEEKPDAAGYKTYKREKTEKSAAKTSDVAEKVAKGEAPTNGKAVEERKPASTLPSVASSAVGKFTVQVGSYPEEKEAKNHAAELKAKGWNAFYFSAPVAGRTWYRVSVGLFKDQNSAKEFRAQFMKDAGTKNALVQKIVQ